MTPSQYQLIDFAARLESWAQKISAVLRDALDEITALRRELTTISPPSPMPGPVTHVGQIVRWLREEGRLLRRQLAAETGVSEATLRNVEMGRHLPTAGTIRKLLTAPCMSPLPALAKAAGLALGLGESGVGDKTEGKE